MTRGQVTEVVLLCLALGVGACAPRKEATAPAPRAEETPAMGTSLECAMSVSPRVRVGEPVELTFRLRNPGAQPVYVLDWHTPLEGLLSNCLKVTRGGVEIPYQGPMFKRGEPDADSYVALAPGAAAATASPRSTILRISAHTWSTCAEVTSLPVGSITTRDPSASVCGSGSGACRCGACA